MKSLIFIIIIISLNALYGLSIYDIQYTTDPGTDGTYPSLYSGQIVTTGGIVHGTDFNNGRFFITSSNGGDWQGIYVYDDNQNVAVGDSVILEAEVYEYYGFTELTDLEYCNIISSANQLPEPVITTTQNADSQESLESVLVEISDVVVTQTYDEYGEWKVSDGSESCYIGIGFFNLQEYGFPLVMDYPFASITGILSFEWGEFKLNCTNLESIQSAPESYVISIEQQYILTPLEFDIPIQLAFLGEQQQTQSYQFDLNYNENIIEYSGYDLTETLSSGGTILVEQPAAGSISVSFTGDFSFAQIQTLLKLGFTGVESGNTHLEFSEFLIDNTSVEYFSIEEITLQLETIPIGDTLTVIQRPIHTIPQITVPNEEFTIDCIADETTENWTAKLIHQNKVLSLDIVSTYFDPALERWQLNVSTPEPEIFELYDLVVNATGIIADTTRNAVQIIPEIRSNYSFIHITDTHLPNHLFYPDPLSITDSTEMEDMREVIKDINLIDPEFVVLTGDLVNEGEMEEFENRRVFTRTQKLLEELKVPLYLTSGNHDVGGWISSPPPQGTARNNWWNFFGWSWLVDPPANEPYYTQNYSFDYGPIHYIGMEAYLNYDNYMPDIYGDQSFTELQMQWLENDLLHATGSESQVIFYHYDFSEQIDLEQMELEMALYGHVHSNNGSITSPPYNLSTKCVCDGNRAYRVINVNNNQLEPNNTVYAGNNGELLSTSFIPENSGEADSLYCFVENYQSLSFNEAKLRFIMPPNAEEYLVYNGSLTQVDNSGEFAVCYVTFNIPANDDISISVVADFDVSVDDALNRQKIQLSNYPNPFNPSTTISFNLDAQNTENIEMMIYNLKGQKVKRLGIVNCGSAVNNIVWDGADENNVSVSSGIYFVRLKLGKTEIQQKIMLLK